MKNIVSHTFNRDFLQVEKTRFGWAIKCKLGTLENSPNLASALENVVKLSRKYKCGYVMPQNLKKYEVLFIEDFTKNLLKMA